MVSWKKELKAMWSPYWDSWTDDILKKMPKDQQGVTPHFVEAFHTYIKTHRRWDDRKKKLGKRTCTRYSKKRRTSFSKLRRIGKQFRKRLASKKW